MEVWKHSQNNPIFFSGKVSIPTFKVKTSLPRSSICKCVFSFTHLHYKPVCTLKFIASLQGKGRLTFMTVKQWYQINGAAPENSMWFTPPEQQGRVWGSTRDKKRHVKYQRPSPGTSNKAILQISLQTVPPNGEQVFIHVSLCREVFIETKQLPSMLACQLLSLGKSCVGSHHVEFSWV